MFQTITDQTFNFPASTLVRWAHNLISSQESARTNWQGWEINKILDGEAQTEAAQGGWIIRIPVILETAQPEGMTRREAFVWTMEHQKFARSNAYVRFDSEGIDFMHESTPEPYEFPVEAEA